MMGFFVCVFKECDEDLDKEREGPPHLKMGCPLPVKKVTTKKFLQ